MKLEWRDEARADLKRIVTYIAGRDSAAAQRLKEAIVDCAARLPDFPMMHRPGRVEGAREAVVHPNYILVYRVGTDAVEIVAVVHARREYP